VVRIRLWRGGKRNRPSYRIVVVDSRSRRDGRVIENVGYYDPLTEPATIQVSQDRIREWVEKGAQMSASVRALLKKTGAFPRGETTIVHRPAAPPPSEET
jgi:small subunit ribosomal protein S16